MKTREIERYRNKRNKVNRKQVKATSVGTPNTLPGKN